jgi:hypothetical protein
MWSSATDDVGGGEAAKHAQRAPFAKGVRTRPILPRENRQTRASGLLWAPASIRASGSIQKGRGHPPCRLSRSADRQ